MQFGGSSVRDSDRYHAEIHVHSPHQGTANRKRDRGARVTHIVIRLDTLRVIIDNPTYADTLASIQAPAMSHPNIRIVTVETIDDAESVDLVARLDILNSIGMLRLRTCKQAQEVAQEALKNPAGYLEDQGVISPLWFSNDFSDDRRKRW